MKTFNLYYSRQQATRPQDEPEGASYCRNSLATNAEGNDSVLYTQVADPDFANKHNTFETTGWDDFALVGIGASNGDGGYTLIEKFNHPFTRRDYEAAKEAVDAGRIVELVTPEIG